METFTNLGPIVDMCVVDLERQGQGQVRHSPAVSSLAWFSGQACALEMILRSLLMNPSDAGYLPFTGAYQGLPDAFSVLSIVPSLC